MLLLSKLSVNRLSVPFFCYSCCLRKHAEKLLLTVSWNDEGSVWSCSASEVATDYKLERFAQISPSLNSVYTIGILSIYFISSPAVPGLSRQKVLPVRSLALL
jgi:hypothetical protein